jgi:hypothetical protein
MTVVRVLLILFWLLSPAIFLFLYLRVGRAQLGLRRWKARTLLAASSVAINWILFAALLIRSQTAYGMIFPTSMLTHVLLALSCVGAVLAVKKWPLLIANVALVTLWIAIAYAPAHWLMKLGPGTVRVDGQRTNATIYFGHPTDSEAETVALAEIPGTGDYFLSFETEKVRPGAENEFVHLPYGIWVFKSLRQMSFVAPLQPEKLNQFRIAAPNGRVIEVQF